MKQASTKGLVLPSWPVLAVSVLTILYGVWQVVGAFGVRPGGSEHSDMFPHLWYGILFSIAGSAGLLIGSRAAGTTELRKVRKYGATDSRGRAEMAQVIWDRAAEGAEESRTS